jgi:hypothetical protein
VSTFALDVAAWCLKAQARGDQALRAISLELLSRIVLRSPVGNPDLWKANRVSLEDRLSLNQLRTLAGKKSFAQRTLNRKVPLKAGKGYTGGRFRGSWVVTVGQASTVAPPRIDKAGGKTIAAGQAVLAEAHLGTVIYMLSNLPYSERLEYGWSTQAPGGMVRVTVAEFQGIVNDAVKQVAPE